MVEDGRQSYSVTDGLPSKDSEPPLRHPIWFVTEAAPYRHESNEDQVLIDSQKRVLGVFDGMGGEAAGKEASTTSSAIFRSILKDVDTADEALAVFTKGFYVSVEAMASLEAENPSKRGMGTTVTVAQVVGEEKEKSVAFLHAGDSRLYVVKRGGRLLQLTKDDNLVQQELRSGEISQAQADEYMARLNNATTMQELGGAKQYWSRRNVVFNGIVAEGFSAPQVGVYPVQAEDRMLLVTSDGVHDNLTLGDIQRLVQHSTPTTFADKLVRKASTISEQGSMRSQEDDITAVVMKL